MTTPYNLEGFRRVAERRLPRPVFDFVDGAATDERTLERNQRDFDRLMLLPSVLRDVRECDTATMVCGQHLSSPLMLAPAGLAGMVHPDGEVAQVVAAACHGVAAVTSSASTYSVDELVAAVPNDRPWFQLYPYLDRGYYGAMVDRAAAAGCRGLCLTVDAAVGGKRERDLANGMTVKPFRITTANAVEFGRHPRWLVGVLRERRIVAQLSVEANGGGRPALWSLLGSAGTSAAQLVELLPRQATWADVEWLRDRWSGPLMIKGVLRAGDAIQAAELGADAIVVSNHGGRQLDGVPSSISILPEIVQAVGGRADVVLDGGVRRGTDIVKALCLGAKACMIGRPWVFALAAGGTAGVDAMLSMLVSELRTTMALLGVVSVGEMDGRYVRHDRAISDVLDGL